MEQSDNLNYEEFARITIERWETRIASFKFSEGSTGALLRSFRSHVEKDANGDAKKMAYTFLFYGYYWDAGVGKGYTPGNSGDLESLANGKKHRKKHHWFNKIFWREFNNLSRMIAEKYGSDFVNECVRQFSQKLK